MYYDQGQVIATDITGNCYVAGFFCDVSSFGTTSLTSSGERDIFVAKLNSDGNWLWAVKAGGQLEDRSFGLAIDSLGNCYIAGYFMNTATFGNTTLSCHGVYDIFIAKLDTNGNWLWAKRAGGISQEYCSGIALDDSANIYMTGGFRYTASFGNTSLDSDDGDFDVFVAKLDTNGNWLWAVRAGGANNDLGSSIALDNSANVYITGDFLETAEFGSTSLTSFGGQDIFIAKLDLNGNWLWSTHAGSMYDDQGYGISVGNSANVYLTGHFKDTAAFGTTSLTSSGSDDIFVSKLDSYGNWLWSVKAGGTSTDYGYCTAVDSFDNITLSGFFHNTAYFGTVSLICQEHSDCFVAKLDTNGNWLGAASAVGYSDCGYGITVDSASNVYLIGLFFKTTLFGSIALTADWDGDVSTYYPDIFIAKLTMGETANQDPTIPDLSALSNLSDAYPNPNRRGETVIIKANIAERESGTLTIFNLRGQCVAVHQLSPGEQQITLDNRKLPAGIYLYKLKTRDKCISKKLVVIK